MTLRNKIRRMARVEDIFLGALVILLGFGGVVGLAYSLEARRSRHGSLGPKLPPPGRVGRALWWTARLITALMLLAIMGAYLLRLSALAWFALACFALFFIDHVAYRIIRLTGK